MDLNQAIELLKTAVKNNSTNDENHIDLTLIPVSDQPMFQEALIVSKLAIKKGEITQDEFKRRVHLDN